jgi:hypothetical protein
MSTEIALPAGIKESDLKYRTPPLHHNPNWYDTKGKRHELFELTMHYTENFGWCIATLGIRRNTRANGFGDRSYGISINDGSLVRIGMGPHVKRTIRVHLYVDRLKDLQQYIDLYNKGLEGAGDVRDRISTRRARTTARRSYW